MMNYQDNDIEKQTRSTLISRNITVMGRRTSVRLEPEMWNALKDISRREQCRIHDLCSLIHLRKNPDTSLTAAIRVFLMLYYRAAATEEGHARAGHGSFDHMMSRARMTAEMLRGATTPLKTPPVSGAANNDVRQMDQDDKSANRTDDAERKVGNGPRMTNKYGVIVG